MSKNSNIPFFKSLGFLLFTWFLIISLVPLGLFVYLSYQDRISELKNTSEIQLQSSSLVQRDFIDNWFKYRLSDISHWSQLESNIKLFSSLSTLSKEYKTIVKFIENDKYAEITDKLEGDLVKISKEYDYIYDFFLIGLKGEILYTLKKEKDLGTNLLTGTYSSSKLATYFKKSIETGDVYFSDLELYSPSKNIPAGFLTAPMIDNTGDLIGVFAIQINPRFMNSSMHNYSKDVHHYLVGYDGLLRSDFSKDKTTLKYKVNLKEINKEKFANYLNPDGKMVLGVHQTVNLLGIELKIISEVKHSAIFANKIELFKELILFLFIIISLIVLIAIYVSKKITKPIRLLADATRLFSKGNRNILKIQDTTAEVQQLSNNFNEMIVSINNNEYELKKFTHNLEDRVKKEVEISSKKDKLMLEESEKAKNKLNQSIELFGENVISSHSDLEGKITYASKALCKISGYTLKELIGQPHSILRSPDMPSKTFKDLWRTIKAGKVWDGEIKNSNKKGESYWVRSSIMPTFNSTGDIVGYSSIRHEITAQKAKEDFMANMSHELRTPLNSIIGFSSILIKKQTDANHIKLSKQINMSSKSLLRLINDILDLSKIKNSKFSLEPFNFNAYDEVLRFSKQLDGLKDKKILTFKIKIGNYLKGTFFGDWHRISQILLNLISNAIKFTSNNGEVILDIDYKNGDLVIIISDNGIGMSKEVQDKIFKPFEQADGSTTRKYGGTGLGLSITQTLVEMMNGRIELDSKKNIGTSFKVTIPLIEIKDSKKREHKPDIKDENKENTLKGNILVVEDNKTNQMLIVMLLEDFGITCDIANDGVEAVKIYRPDKHALILMDENMPNMSGLEAMNIIQDKYKDKCGAIIALTANTMAGDKERFLELGMDGYISKPIDEDKLYKTIKAFL